MGGLLKTLAPIAAVAAAPFTGGTSLAGLGTFLGTAGKVLSAVNTAQSLFGGGGKKTTVNVRQPPPPQPVQPAEAPPFKPVRPDEMQRPESLGGEFSSFSPEQQRSALATKGLNTGLGSDEDSYYRNLIQRSLIGDNNQVTSQTPDQFLLPIESQYFSRQGADTSDLMRFLQSLSG